MEVYAEALALEKNCSRIEWHCSESRIDTHRFYKGQGYVESPKYYIKTIGKSRKGLKDPLTNKLK